jgi:hypothetical protein
MTRGRSTIPAEWWQHLTPGFRGDFDRDGEATVQFAVSNRGYVTREKQLAAQVGLVEQRTRRQRRDTFRVHAISGRRSLP